MRINIHDIINVLHCDESHAEKVERQIDRLSLIDWSEAASKEIKIAAIEADQLLKQED